MLSDKLKKLLRKVLCSIPDAAELASAIDGASAGVLDLANGVLTASGDNLETNSTTATAVSVSKLLTELVSGASPETRTLAAPAAGDCRIKIIRLKTDGGGDIEIAATNVLGETGDFTFGDVGDCLILMSTGAGKWVKIGGNLTAA